MLRRKARSTAPRASCRWWRAGRRWPGESRAPGTAARAYSTQTPGPQTQTRSPAAPEKGVRLVGGCGIFLLRDCDWSMYAVYSYTFHTNPKSADANAFASCICTNRARGERIYP
eukprot:1193165-Prorocentrum_minimum.AAC.2